MCGINSPFTYRNEVVFAGNAGNAGIIRLVLLKRVCLTSIVFHNNKRQMDGKPFFGALRR